MKSATLWVIADTARLETGLWCERCLLPSGWRVPLLALSTEGIGPVGAIARCRDCDQPLTAA